MAGAIIIDCWWGGLRERKLLLLTVTQGPDRGADYRFIGESRVIIGRGSPHFKLADLMVSHGHARLKCVDGQWSIRDLKSRNGTFVNDRRIAGDVSLKQGDQIRVGYTAMTFSVVDDPADPVSLDDAAFDAIESLKTLPDESQKFETIESLIKMPDEPEPVSETAPEQDADQGDETEQASSENPQQADAPAEPTPVAEQSEPASPISPVKPSAEEENRNELMGVLAFDQANPDDVDDAPVMAEGPLNPAEMNRHKPLPHDPDANDTPESTDNDWNNLVQSTLTVKEKEGWDTPEDEDEEVERTDQDVLNDLSREESDADESKEEAVSDLPFEEYLAQQQALSADVNAGQKATPQNP